MKADLARLGSEALDLAVEQGLNYRDVRECAWALLVDAMKTASSLPGDGPRAIGSSMPEAMPDHWESFGTIREQISEGLAKAPAPRMPRYLPSARAVSRYDDVMTLWHPQTFRGAVRRPESVTRAMMLWAGGSTPSRVAITSGVPKGSLRHYRNITCLTVGRKVLPHLEAVVEECVA